MSWFQRFLLNFRTKWKSYTVSLILAASIAANIAVWKAYSDQTKKMKFSKATVMIIKKHGFTLKKTEANIGNIVEKANSAKNLAEEADPLIAEGNVSAAEAKLAEARKMLNEIPGLLEKLNFEELQAELAVIKARVQKEPELAASLARIAKNEARLREMIAWRERMLETTGLDIQQVEERASALD